MKNVDDLKINVVNEEFDKIVEEIEENVELNVYNLKDDFKNKVIDKVDFSFIKAFKTNINMLMRDLIKYEVIYIMRCNTEDLYDEVNEEFALELLEDGIKIIRFLDNL